MSSSDAMIREAIAGLEKKDCKCVYCDTCRGTGSIRVHYDPLGRIEPSYGDDMDDLETCDQCRGGVVEICQRCSEIEELESQLEPL